MRFAIDILQTVSRLLPDLVREVMAPWLYCLLYPLKYLNTSFVDFVALIERKTSFTGQVIYLEQVLNEDFDPTGPGNAIYITDGTSLPETYIYFQAESVDTAFIYYVAESAPSETYIYDVAESVGNVDFIINIPISLVFDLVLLQATVALYKAAGRRYSINYY